MKKTFSIIFIFILILTSVSFAFDSNIVDPSPSVPSELEPTVGNILGAIQYFGVAIAIGMLIYIGIKYVMSAAAEKAELKQTLIHWVIGAIIIFSVSVIFGWLVEFFQNVDKETSPSVVPSTTNSGGIGIDMPQTLHNL